MPNGGRPFKEYEFEIIHEWRKSGCTYRTIAYRALFERDAGTVNRAYRKWLKERSIWWKIKEWLKGDLWTKKKW